MSSEADELWASFIASRTDEFDLQEERAGVAAATAEHPRHPGVRETIETVAGVEAVVVRPEDTRNDLVVLWLHGGAFTVMRAADYSATAGHLAAELGCDVIIPDYAIAPEAQYPVALDQVEGCYRALVDEAPDRTLVLLGDSAGAALAGGLLHRRRNAGEPLPFLTVMVCPWLDLTLTNRSLTDNAAHDAVLGAAPLADHAAAYLGNGTARDDPEASPFHGDLGGIGPIMIQAAEFDVLVDDAIRFTRKARAAGTEVELEIAAEMPHSYQFFTGVIPEADMALTRLASTVRRRIEGRAHRETGSPPSLLVASEEHG
ncbi:MAG: alpha/beta hydrolase [Actinomycetota bacterium]